MKEYIVTFVIPHYAELVVEANDEKEALRQAKELGAIDADWDLLDDVSYAKIFSVEEES